MTNDERMTKPESMGVGGSYPQIETDFTDFFQPWMSEVRLLLRRNNITE